jgi:hypothetical protein
MNTNDARAQINAEITRISRISETIGITLDQNAQGLLHEYLITGCAAGLIGSPVDISRAAAAFVGGAITLVVKDRPLTITSSALEESWYKELSLGPGNCPPHECMRRSVIERFAFVLDKYPVIKALLPSDV